MDKKLNLSKKIALYTCGKSTNFLLGQPQPTQHLLVSTNSYFRRLLVEYFHRVFLPIFALVDPVQRGGAHAVCSIYISPDDGLLRAG